MYTIKDYLDYYKDIPFEEQKFNVMDNILFSSLVYLPIENITNKSITIHELAIMYKKEQKTLDASLNYIGKKSVPLLFEIIDSTRYKNVLLDNIKSILNSKVQFFALTFRYNSTAYVAFRGTDNSISGWKENFTLSYNYPTETQIEAVNYLNETITPLDKKIYLGGHSKGGNLAMTCTLEAKEDIYNRIKCVYNNDGPGFLQNEYQSSKYDKLSKKLYNIIPEESVIGILLNNKNYNIVCSVASGVRSHDLTTWRCFGQFLVQGKLSRFSKLLKERATNWLIETDDKSKAQIIETFFKVIEESGAIHFRDLTKTEIINLVRKSSKVDEKSKQLLLDTLKIFMNIT